MFNDIIFLFDLFVSVKLGTLYMRRRTQLLRENGMKYREERDIASLRRLYLNLRTQILENKYGDVDKM